MDEILLLADDIASRGITDTFGIPGSGSSYSLIDALEARGVRFHTVHFEGSAALMAGAQGRLSGKAGTAISIKGPGLTNLLPGMAACKFEAFPLISISEAYAADVPKSRAHKNISHQDLVSAITKGRGYVKKGQSNFSELADWAEAEVPGPVHLDLAHGPDAEKSETVEIELSSPADRSLGLVLNLIGSCEKPVVIAGTAAARGGFSELLNRLNVPVFSTAAAKGVVDETLPHAAGVFTGVGLDKSLETKILPHADLVIGIGLRHNEVLSAKAMSCPSINLDVTEASNYSAFGFEQVIAPTMTNVEALFELLLPKSWYLDELKLSNDRLRDYMLNDKFLPAHVFDAIERKFSGEIRLVLDTGYFCTIGEHIWRCRRPDWYLSSGQGRYMGIGLPLAIGAALFDSSLPTCVALGDGGIGMFVSEAKLAVRHQLPLIVVLMTDGYFGSIYTRGLKDNLTDSPVRINSPSWQAVLSGLGVNSVRVENYCGLDSVLSSWTPQSGPLFIEASFDFEPYQDMVRGIR